jgi:ABC-type transport system substrate-binding protein
MVLVPLSNVHSAKKVSVCSNDSVQQLDPHETNDEASMEEIYLKIYEPLVKRSANKKVIIPLLVKDWHNNGLEWKFKLRENVMFHSNKYFKPTRPMNTQDIKFSFERLLASTSNISLNLKKWIDEIKIVDQQTIVFKLKKQGDFLEVLLLSAAIMSKEYYEQLEEKDKLHLFTARPIGTGPFSFKSFKKGSYFKLQSFKKYHFGTVLFDELEFLKVYSNKQIDMLKFEICNMIFKPKRNVVRSLFESKDLLQRLNITSGEHKHTLSLLLNLNSPISKDTKMQNLIYHGLKLQEYSKKNFYGLAKILLKEIPSDTISRDNLIDNKKTLKLLITNTSKVPNIKKLVLKLKSHLKDKAINLKVIKTSKDSFKNLLNEGNYHLALTDMNMTSPEFLKVPLLSWGDLLITNHKIKNFYYSENFVQDYSTIQILND